jgi:hypothetical protein
MRLLQAQSLRLHLVVIAFELFQLELKSLLNEPIHQAAHSWDFLGVRNLSHHESSLFELIWLTVSGIDSC